MWVDEVPWSLAEACLYSDLLSVGKCFLIVPRPCCLLLHLSKYRITGNFRTVLIFVRAPDDEN